MREAWNLLGGAIDWQGVGLLLEVLEVEDPLQFVRDLVVLQDHMRSEKNGTA